MPDGHHVNQKGLDFYDQIIHLCLENHIEPIPTLYHFEMPQALVDEFGGWKTEDALMLLLNMREYALQNGKVLLIIG